ncbi:MAG: DNA repair and recombination protein RadB [Methanomicrobiales archaeon]|nr:DNA repair and recombination protein RadB [Methanomicrobiales archaeon]MDI6876884.1 DNA repair and recombination protein RadB [Methanomicrobiales archaeon]
MNAERMPMGVEALDDLLGGGLERRSLTQVYGEPGSGKSTICIIAAVAALKSGKGVIFFDTEGFSVERFRQIAGEDAEELAGNLFIYEPADFDRQGLMIAESETLLRRGTVGLIVVDSATALYRTELGETRDAQRKLARQMIHLLGLAKKYDLPVLITNQVYIDVDTEEFRGLGGTALLHLSKTIVRIEKRDGFRRAVLVKHRSLPEGTYFDFVITGEGISRV